MREWRKLSAALAVAAGVCAAAGAQTHKVAKPENVVRAVGVYEWTGDMAKPAAMRLVPITLYIDNHLEDAGVYLARPVPFALLTGNLYEVQQAGVPKGMVELSFSRHFEPTEKSEVTPYDDGWFGYGRFVPPAAPKKSTLRASKEIAVIDTGDDSRPHFSSKSARPGSGGAAAGVPSAGAGGSGDASGNAPAADPDRPTLHKGSSSGSGSSAGTPTAGNTPAEDPDRPTMRRKTDTASDSRETTIDDPDRPTLRRRSPEQADKAKDEHAGVTDVPSLNDDPNRPKLVRGKPATPITDKDFPKLSGLPGEQDLHQMVAVSDAANRPVHDFARAFEDESEKQVVLGKMEAAAQAQLAAYAAANGGSATAKGNAPPPGDARHPNSKLRRGVTPDTKPAAAPEAAKLADEQLKAYTLSYGAPATYVYTAHTEGMGPELRYVTVVAEVDMQGNPQIALKSVTDAAHLDRTPRMRLIDAVDVEASNRASLLFELREQGSRQFALYRVIGAHADQIFLTGTTQ